VDFQDTVFKGDHPRTIVTKFGFNWPSSFRAVDLCTSLRRTMDDDDNDEDGCQVITIHVNIFSVWYFALTDLVTSGEQSLLIGDIQYFPL
jgi:hypothetical protein